MNGRAESEGAERIEEVCLRFKRALPKDPCCLSLVSVALCVLASLWLCHAFRYLLVTTPVFDKQHQVK